MKSILKDIRYGIRSLLKQPSFTVVAVITLALGIGATTAIFSVMNALILRPPQIKEADRVVAIWKTPLGNHVEGFLSYLELQDWRSRTQSFEDIAGYKPIGFIVSDLGEAERIEGMEVTSNFFPLLKVNPIRGRNFQVDEERRGAPLVAIVSYDFWQSRFGGNEAVLDQKLTVNGKPHTIVGILPPGFDFPLSARGVGVGVWTTVAVEGQNLDERGAFLLRGFGRLRPDATIEQAQTEMSAIAARNIPAQIWIRPFI
jgi:putative ABC transport system permease protein